MVALLDLASRSSAGGNVLGDTSDQLRGGFKALHSVCDGSVGAAGVLVFSLEASDDFLGPGSAGALHQPGVVGSLG